MRKYKVYLSMNLYVKSQILKLKLLDVCWSFVICNYTFCCGLYCYLYFIKSALVMGSYSRSEVMIGIWLLWEIRRIHVAIVNVSVFGGFFVCFKMEFMTFLCWTIMVWVVFNALLTVMLGSSIIILYWEYLLYTCQWDSFDFRIRFANLVCLALLVLLYIKVDWDITFQHESLHQAVYFCTVLVLLFDICWWLDYV